MKLRITTGSPFARKVRILARETGLASRIEEIVVQVSPVEHLPELQRENPLAKIPVLLLDDGAVLHDSTVICEYIDTLHSGTKAVPLAGTARWATLRRQALADGVLDASILCRYEAALRPEAMRWPAWFDGQQRKVFAGMQALEAELDSACNRLDMGWIAAACALGYLDYRFADWAWRSRLPRLAAWHADLSQRPSLAETAPF